MIYNDYNLFIVRELNYYKDSDAFTTDDGLHIAAGVISFEDDPSVGTKEDPEIGTLKFYLKAWDFNDPVTGGELTFTEIPLRPCQNKDFNNGDGNNLESKFYPTNEFSERTISLYQNSIKCIDQDQISLNGHYDSSQANNLMIVFEKCNPNLRLCKSEQ